MVHLHTLGSLDLRGSDGQSIRSVLAQPKRLALLAHLAISATRGFHRRDTLLALFWPESDTERARASLRTALSVLRRALGEGVVVGRGGDDVGIDADQLWCDAVSFEEAHAAGDYEHALKLYRGDLLAGFYIDDAPDFERWLEEERTRVREKASAAARALAERDEQAGNYVAAAEWARRAAAISPDNEGTVRRLITLLDRSGDRDGARRTYRSFVDRLQAEYGLEPSAEMQALGGLLSERLQTVDPALMPPALPTANPVGNTAEPQVSASRAGEAYLPSRGSGRPPLSSIRRVHLGAGALVGLVVLALAGVLHEPARTSPAYSAARDVRLSSVAVLPFADMSEQADQEYFSDGITEELINTLANVEGLQVVARTSVFAFKGTQADVRDIGEKLGVAAVLEGSVRRSGDRVRVTAQLINTATGYHLWSETYERRIADLFTIQDEISRAIASKLTGSFLGAGAIAGSNGGRTADPEAHDRYLRGLYFVNRGSADDLRRAADLFTEALSRDPHYALAYAGLAETYLQYPNVGLASPEVAFAKARNAAVKALEIDGRLAEAHVALAVVSFVGDWDFAAAEQSYQRSIELSTRSTAHSRYPFYLVAMGRTAEAVAAMRQVVARDPLSIRALTRFALVLYYNHEYDAALEQLQRALLLDPTDYTVHWYLGLVHMQKRMHRDAIQEIQSAVRLSGESPLVLATLGSAYARAGRREEALKIRAQLGQPTNRAYLRPQGMVFLLSDLGDKEGALQQLEAAVADRSIHPHVLTTEPLLDSMRSDPRFTRLLKQANLHERAPGDRPKMATTLRQ